MTEEEMRRKWAEVLRKHFADQHDHASGSAECTACGGEEAADILDPDTTDLRSGQVT